MFDFNSKYRIIRRKLKYKKYLYENDKINFNNYLLSFISYSSLQGGSNEKEF